ncbi:hypothetical protein [Aquabacterium sp. UBA2148]|uniref:hypothetical protein n=1 Tax=Aquabacterium sp. UBA2148 TaxID=1946042 RepID=UPI00257D2F4E|nr:hypothetical protein [Aquabacterium sp. UBA2148]
MSVRYRPICPQQAWRSQLAHSLTSVERFGELYLLTNPAANAIGCYPLIPRIAAAEIGMSADEMQNVILRLEEMSVAILRDGHILVKTWFLHSTWESTLTGNVLKTALADIRRMPPQLHTHWRDACVAAGAPAPLVDDCMVKALQSPCQGTTKALAHTNETEPRTNSDTTTTNDSHSESALWLSPGAEAHRQTLLRIAREGDLTPAQMQELGYELSARIDAASQGTGKSIGVASRWLSALAQAQRQGQSILQAGVPLRDAQHRTRAKHQQQDRDATAREEERNRSLREREQAESALQALDDAALERLISKVRTAAQTPVQAARDQQALRERRLPASWHLTLKQLLMQEGLMVGVSQR